MARYFQDALPRFALHGRVSIREGVARLEGSQGIMEVDLGTLAARWELLDEHSRRERVVSLVRELSRQRNQPARSATKSVLPWQTLPLWPLAVVGGIAGIVAIVYGSGVLRTGGHGPAPAPRKVPLASVESPEARTRRVCEATKARAARGTTVNMADTDGWVVELMALRAPGGKPLGDALRPFVGDHWEQGTFVWPEEPSLSAGAGDLAVVRSRTVSLKSDAKELEQVIMTFEGPLVDAYFREDERSRYFHVASAISSALGASHAGLYARCAHEDSHYLGSWFRGPSEGGAVSALVFAIGAYADPPHIATPFLKPLGQGPDLGYAFGNIEAATNSLTRAKLSDVMGKSQGMATGAPKAAVTLTFTFRDASAAGRASREFARNVGLLAD